MNKHYLTLLSLAALALVQTLSAQNTPPLFSEDFEKGTAVPSTWQNEGAVAVESGSAFQGKNALVLSKTEATLRAKTSSTGPSFPVSPGTVNIEFATKTDLTSMDNSYNGTLSLQFFDGSGKSLGGNELGAWFRQSPWKKSVVSLPVPDGAATAKLVAAINKETPGKFWVDAVSVKITAGGDDDGLRRMVFTMAQLGHMILPTDSRVASVEVWSTKELPENLRKISFTVLDYWGAEQNKPIRAELKAEGKVDGKNYFKYKTKVDLAGIDFNIGRYYELHGEITRTKGEAFTNYTSFAILPEAAANQYKPEDVPFTSRTWDQRFKESPLLTKRLGIRICNVWGRMNADPAKMEAIQIDLVEELKMGVLTSSPAQGVEARNKGWEKLLANDGAELRKGVRNFFAKYGHIKPMIVNLGNEPHSKGEDVKQDVEAYRIVYTEVKKIDPSVFVVGTSIGTSEDYFKYGFGEWCDAYDFHSYEDPEGVRSIITQKYPAMFKKYGFPKPVWSTEIGMNSQGMSRQAVASILYKKFANFFAGGGANVSWFGLFYPDPDAKIHDSFAAAHNVFDCRYNQYSPKMDAIAYYNAVNGIAIKKFITDKVYGSDTRVFLFRDRDNRSLVIAYKDKGREDIFLPLPGAKSVEMIRLDGTRTRLDPAGKGVSLTIDEDPILLLFENGPQALPEKLEASPLQVSSLPDSLSREGENIIEVSANGIAPEKIDLKAPPFWEVRRTSGTPANGKTSARFAVKAAPDSQVREADLALMVREDGKDPSALLSRRVGVTPMLAMEVLPVPLDSEKGPGVKILVRNNSAVPKNLTWNLELNGEQGLEKGKFSEIVSSSARFAGETTGVLKVGGNASAEVMVALADTKPITVYHVKGTVQEESGKITVQERPISGFVPVRKAAERVKVDGILDEAAWKSAHVEKLDKANQFFGFKAGDKVAPVWSGVDDLSAEIRYTWDDQFLYVSVAVKDDIAGLEKFQDSSLWQQDGLQFLVDPARRSKQKPGKYEYTIGLGKKGAQTWCTLSADALAPAGNSPDIKLVVHRDKADTGNVTYEVAIPWVRFSPFKPVAGNDLGFTLIVNEDDGQGRNAFMTWFGNAHSKDIDTVGDLILMP